MKFKDGVDPQEVLGEAGLGGSSIERMFPITSLVNKFKKDYELERDEGGWYWFLGKKYKEVENIDDEEIFKEAYAQMSPKEQEPYRSYKITLPEGTNVEEAARELSERPEVEYAEPNYIMKELATPNDAKYGVQWPLNNEGQYYPEDNRRSSRGMPDCDIDAPEGWDIRRNSGDIIVAVVDSGVQYNHRDLRNNMWVNKAEQAGSPGVDDDNNDYIDDIYGYDFCNGDANPIDDRGHGTHCAGIIAAEGNNGKDIAGVSWSAQIMALKFLDSTGSGYSSDAVKAIEYARLNGAKVISNSWGGGGRSSFVEAAVNAAFADGIVIIAAAGNEGTSSPLYPAGYDNVIAVAATDSSDRGVWWTNYGNWIDVSAPGVDILSLRASGTSMGDALDPYTTVASGTSMACPHVAGLAALLRAALPDGGPYAICAALKAGADNIDSLNPGKKGLLGAGRINMLDSLESVNMPYFELVTLNDESIRPGEAFSLTLQLRNALANAAGVTGVLSCSDPSVTILSDTVPFGDMSFPAISAGTFEIFTELTSAGQHIAFELILTCQGGYTQVVPFNVVLPFFATIDNAGGLPLVDYGAAFMAMGDYDNDGFSDVCMSVGDYRRMELYKNQQDSAFVKVTDETGITGHLMQIPLFIDIDNDGDKDLFLPRGVRELLFLNNGDGSFTNITDLGEINWTYCWRKAVAFDYDNDGFVDILGGWKDHASKDVSLFLLRNNGDNTFTDVITQTGLPAIESGDIVNFDYDNDNDQDLLLSRAIIQEGDATIEKPMLYRNNGDGTFTDVSESSMLEGPAYAADAGDFDNDGNIDLFFTKARPEGSNVASKNILYKNNGDGTFASVTEGFGKLNFGGSSGNAFFDYDNDGDLDIHITMGYSNMEGNIIYANNGDGTVTNVRNRLFPKGIKPYYGGACIGDINNDGALDMYVPTTSRRDTSQGALLENYGGRLKNWIKIELVGIESNRGAYGARVYVKTGSLRQLREVHTSCVETMPLHFGLGDREVINEIEVRWPSGSVQIVCNVRANQLVDITERAGHTRTIYRAYYEGTDQHKYKDVYDEHNNLLDRECYAQDGTLKWSDKRHYDETGTYTGKTMTYANGNVKKYDADNKLTYAKYILEGGKTSTSYYENGNRVKTIYSDAGGNLIWELDLHYDATGTYTGKTQTYANGKAEKYDANNNLIKYTLADGRYYIYERENGNVNTRIFHNSSGNVIFTDTYEYDAQGGLTGIMRVYTDGRRRHYDAATKTWTWL
ncbi:MAG: S8 family serine peptidase [Candidatus Omnitrophica bacterium]|nr:S8 family serine peptidase [Candidatus Omnitrophota bacterium]